MADFSRRILIRIAGGILICFCSAITARSETLSPASPETPTQPPAAREIAIDERLRLEKHRPIYFAYSPRISKLQLSFKSKLLTNVPFYFGYNQLIFWRLLANSRPIDDVTFNPEFFYRLRPFDGASVLESIDIGLLEHRSNGKQSADSRSLNSNFVGLNFRWGGRRWLTVFSSKLSFSYDFDEPNWDILEYWGPLQLELSFIQLFDAWFDKTEFKITAHPGGKFAQNWARGGYMAEVSFRPGGLDIVPAIYLQYYRGHAESLLNYKESVNEFRIGLIF